MNHEVYNWVGYELNGWCGCVFGRLEYGPFTIEQIGYDWMVVRNSEGRPLFASFDSHADMIRDINSWIKDWEGELKYLSEQDDYDE